MIRPLPGGRGTAIVPWHGSAAMIIRRHLVAFGGTKESSLNHEAVTHKVATRFIFYV